MNQFHSVEGHGADLSVVPTRHFCRSLQGDESTCAGLENHTFLFTLVEELLLASGEWVAVRCPILLLVLMEAEVFVACINLLVALSIGQAGPQRGPCRHQ